MRKVERSESVDFVTYEERRDGVRDSAMRAKGERRVHVGPATFSPQTSLCITALPLASKAMPPKT